MTHDECQRSRAGLRRRRRTRELARAARSSRATRRPRSALLPMLHLVQAEEGYVSPAGIEFCAEHARPDHGRGRRGRDVLHDVQAPPDRRVPRRRLHQHAVRDHGRRRDLRARSRSTSASATTRPPTDGKITLEHIECNAACDYAPVVMVNWEFFDNQTPQSAARAGRRPARRQAGAAHPRPAAVAPSARSRACSPASPTAAPTRARRPAPRRWSASARPRRRLDRTRPTRRPRAAGPAAADAAASSPRRAPATTPATCQPATERTSRPPRAGGADERHADPGPHRHLGRRPLLDARRPTRRTTATQALRKALAHAARRRHHGRSRTPACAAAAAPASRPA